MSSLSILKLLWRKWLNELWPRIHRMLVLQVDLSSYHALSVRGKALITKIGKFTLPLVLQTKILVVESLRHWSPPPSGAAIQFHKMRAPNRWIGSPCQRLMAPITVNDEHALWKFWGRYPCIRLVEKSWPSNEIPWVEISGGRWCRNSNNAVDKMRGESRVELLEAMCRMMNGSGDWSRSRRASALKYLLFLGP